MVVVEAAELVWVVTVLELVDVTVELVTVAEEVDEVGSVKVREGNEV